ncbi:MAG: hypothetical protein N2Z70_06370, partial [Bdellovibrionaceae bacterium]|nr:hypothetical protein [Pseudobdellovibrionaceae bacterium]
AIPKPTPPPPAGTPRGGGPEVPVLSQKSADSSSAQQRVSGRKSLGGEFSKQARARFHPRWRTQNWSKNFITKMKPEVLGGRLEKMAEEQGIQGLGQGVTGDGAAFVAVTSVNRTCQL